MDLKKILERWYTPAHGGNRDDAAPYRVLLAPVTRGEHLAHLAASEGLRMAQEGQEQYDALVRLVETSNALLRCVVAVEGLFDDGEPVGAERYREIVTQVPDLRVELVRMLMASAVLSAPEGKA